MSDILEKHDIKPSLYLFEWFITLFSNRFTIQTVRRLWDQFFYFGQIQVFKCALAICKCLEPYVLENRSSYEMVITSLMNPKDHIEEKDIIPMMSKIKINEGEFFQALMGVQAAQPE